MLSYSITKLKKYLDVKYKAGVVAENRTRSIKNKITLIKIIFECLDQKKKKDQILF